MRTFPFHSLALALSLGLWGCAALPPVMDRAATVQRGTASLTLMPHLVEERSTQANVPIYNLASIARLEVIPYVETASGSYQPLSRVTSQATDEQDADILKVSQSAPIRLQRPVRLTGLTPGKTYRVYARAYNAQGGLISSDASSFVTVDVGTDATTKIPLRLADKYFAASTQVTLSNGQRPAFTTVETSLWLRQGASKVLVDGTTQTHPKPQTSTKLRLAGLKANTSYDLVASMRNAGGVEVASTSTTINVYSDDAPSNSFLALHVPPPPVFTLAGLSNLPGFMDGQGGDGDNLARLSSPGGTAYDGFSNLYVADTGNHAIRRFTLSGGSVTASSALGTIAGNGQAGLVDDSISGLNARFNSPGGLAIDNSGNLYVADTGNHVIRLLTKSGSDWIVSTIAGNGAAALVDGQGTSAAFNGPKGIIRDSSGNLYVADTGNHVIRKLTKSGSNWLVSTIAGDGTPGFADASGLSAKFANPSGVALDNSGNLYVADTNNHAIRRVSSANGAVTTLAGAGPGTTIPPAQDFVNGIGTLARFNSPSGIVFDGNGNLFVTDSGNHAIRKIPINTSSVSTFTGAVIQPGSGFQDGSLVQATFNNPTGISNYYASKFFVMDTGNHAIRMITP